MIEQMYPYKILFVEDENAIRENYTTYLKMFFNEVYEASDGEEALMMASFVILGNKYLGEHCDFNSSATSCTVEFISFIAVAASDKRCEDSTDPFETYSI